MRKLIGALLVAGCLMAVGVWWNQGAAAVTVTDEQRDQALQDGSGAAGITLENPGPGVPASLADARALLGDEALEQARAGLAERVASEPDCGAAHVLYAEVLRRLGNAKLACEHGKRGAELLPTSSRAHWVHARAIVTDAAQLGRQGGMGMLAAAKRMGPYQESLRTAIELDPAHVEARKEEVLFLLFAPMVGDVARGTELAHELEAIDPMEGGLCVARALSRAEGGLEAALEKARQVEAATPGHTDPPWVLASLLLEAERYDEADAALARVLEGPRGETYYQALHLRARTCNERGTDHVKALAYLDEYAAAEPAWEWVPGEAEVLVERGRALAGLGRADEARSALEAALELDPSSKRAKAALDELQ